MAQSRSAYRFGVLEQKEGRAIFGRYLGNSKPVKQSRKFHRHGAQETDSGGMPYGLSLPRGKGPIPRSVIHFLANTNPLKWCARLVQHLMLMTAALTIATSFVGWRPLTTYANDTYRTIDGKGNNLANPDWGSANNQLIRPPTEAHYGDDGSTPVEDGRPNPRIISNAVVSEGKFGSETNSRGLSSFFWQWGQFLDHDIDLTPTGEDAYHIAVPQGDPYFDPNGTGNETIEMFRSRFDPETGNAADNPRQQSNIITSFIDASSVYGSDSDRALWLRTYDGGKLKTSTGDLLPFNHPNHPLENAIPVGAAPEHFFVAGDIRANEQVGLTALHTLFVREHNRLADQIAYKNPSLDEEDVYQKARLIVGAEIQAITYNEFLPLLLGSDALPSYKGYDDTVDPSISNIFATAAYRVGHSMIPTELLRLDKDGNEIAAGNLDLSDAFFAPQRITDEGGIEPILKGLAIQQAEEIDTILVNDLRNFLFGQPGSGGFDLASLNIQRGRDHGLPTYNQARIDYGLKPILNFSDITMDEAIQLALEEVYQYVDNIDVWVGGLAEDHVHGAVVGELFFEILKDQFTRLQVGDRHWYEKMFAEYDLGYDLEVLRSTRLSNIIRWNTDITGIQDDVFVTASTNGVPEPSTMLLIATGLVGLVGFRRKFRS